MYLSFSGYSTYDKCQKKYYLRYIGKVTPPKPDNRVNMLFGAAVGASFENFYNERLWRYPDYLKRMTDGIPKLVEKVMADEVARGGIIDWEERKKKDVVGSKDVNYKSLDDLIKDILETIPRGLASIRQHRLIGKIAGAEVKLDSVYEGHKLAGRADFIIHRVPPADDLCLLDGKGTKYREDAVNSRQLRWYAMLHELKHGALPDKVGFLYWREDPSTSLDAFKVTSEETAHLRALVVSTCNSIEERTRRLPVLPEQPSKELLLELFPATPNRDDCKWCDYLLMCEEGSTFLKNRGKAPIPEILDSTGVEDIGL
jgi:hypothetical protein